MDVLELYAADQVGDFVEGSEGSGPVGDGESGVVARDQGSGDDEQEYPAGEEDREAVMRAVVRCGQGLQNGAPSLPLIGMIGFVPSSNLLSPLRGLSRQIGFVAGGTPALLLRQPSTLF